MKKKKFKLLDYEKDVSDKNELKSKHEKLCYLFRYNAHIFIARSEYDFSKMENNAFMNMRDHIEEKRYYEIMNMADNDFYERYGL